MGICGTAMAALAGMFHERGFRVTGSDEGIYPPMSDFLGELGIHVIQGYHPSNLDSRPGLVVVGNVIRRSNPEALELERSGIPFITMPAAVTDFFSAGKNRIVVTGTHGKTTVSSMIAWILHCCGLEPSFMIGGIPRNFGTNYRLGNGDFFVIEGDEYDTAYFEKTPKFLHYRPHMGVMTSCEFDHADIYESLDEIKDQFRAFCRLLPADGFLAAYGNDAVGELISGTAARVETYGRDASSDWQADEVREARDGIFAAITKKRIEVARGTLPIMGFHNLMNALAAVAVADKLDVDPQQSMNALASFKGVKRRQQIISEIGGILIMDDFAHHPTAVKATCSAARSRFPDRRLVAVFEPRTNTNRRAVFQKDYVGVFEDADLVVIAEPSNVAHIPENERFSAKLLADDLSALGKKAGAFPHVEDIVEFLSQQLQNGDLVLIMSNGNFGNMSTRLMKALEERPL